MRATPRWIVGALLLALTSGCWFSQRPDHVYGSITSTRPPLVLVTSGDNVIGTQVTESITRSLDYPISEFVIKNPIGAGHIVQAIRVIKPRLIIALGHRAALLAHEQFPDIPLLFALVVQDDQHSILGENSAGIGIDLAPTNEFTMYKFALPAMHSVGTVYTPGRGEQLALRASEALAAMNLQLELVPISSASELGETKVTSRLHSVDAIWLANDPGLLSEAAFARILHLAQSLQKPLLCSSFREFALAGALMAFTLDFDNIGSQIATAAAEILEYGTRPEAIGLRPPLGGNLVVNATVAEKLGIHLPAQIVPFISEIVTSNEH